MSNFKAYRVDFKYSVEDTASMYVIADTPDNAKLGCEQMLAENDSQYQSAEVTHVEVYQNSEAPTIQ